MNNSVILIKNNKIYVNIRICLSEAFMLPESASKERFVVFPRRLRCRSLLIRLHQTPMDTPHPLGDNKVFLYAVGICFNE